MLEGAGEPWLFWDTWGQALRKLDSSATLPAAVDPERLLLDASSVATGNE